jgi:hypothetical protein
MPIAARTARRASFGFALALLVLFAAILAGLPQARADNGGGGETISVTIPWAGTVHCTKGGTTLGPDPTLRGGDHLHCTVTGLSPGEGVSVAVRSVRTSLGTATADSDGTVVSDPTVPGDLAAGAHTLTFTGHTSKAVASYPFTLAAGTGQTSSAAGFGAAGSGGSGDGIAFTGADILGMLAAALALIGGVPCWSARTAGASSGSTRDPARQHPRPRPFRVARRLDPWRARGAPTRRRAAGHSARAWSAGRVGRVGPVGLAGREAGATASLSGPTGPLHRYDDPVGDVAGFRFVHRADLDVAP